jgi:hypothetical protein
MRTVRTALLTTLAALTLASPAFAKSTKTRERTRIVGNSAVASWDYTDGNIGTTINVVVTYNDESYTATGPGQYAFVALNINRYEIDSGNVLITGNAYVDGPSNFSFAVDNDLGTATLHVRDAIFQDDNSFTFFNVNMDLTWTATGTKTTGVSNFNDKGPGYKYNSHFNGQFRDATATGSIFGTNCLGSSACAGANTQFSPVPSNSGQLQFNHFGENSLTTQSP